MFTTLILPILGLTLIYALVILVMYFGLARLGLSSPRAILVAFLLFGFSSGLLALWAWPRSDAVIYVNLFAIYAADKLYIILTDFLGTTDPAHAHELLPEFLRVPQIYLVSALSLSAIVGSLAALLLGSGRDYFNRRR